MSVIASSSEYTRHSRVSHILHENLTSRTILHNFATVLYFVSEYRVVQGSRGAMESTVTVVNQLTSELLCFVQSKMTTNDHDVVVKTVAEFYTNNKIIATKTLLFEFCTETALRMKTYKVNVVKLNCRDIITKMNDVGVNCPVFVAANLAKLPIITTDAFNLAKMSKDISSVLNIEQNVDNLLTTLA